MGKTIISLVGVAASIVGVTVAAVKSITGSKSGKGNPRKYGVKMVDSKTGDDLEIFDDVFDTEKEAQEYALECGGYFSEGAEVLDCAGRDFTEPSTVDFEVFSYQ